jgi:hypothetical protein
MCKCQEGDLKPPHERRYLKVGIGSVKSLSPSRNDPSLAALVGTRPLHRQAPRHISILRQAEHRQARGSVGHGEGIGIQGREGSGEAHNASLLLRVRSLRSRISADRLRGAAIVLS